MGKKLGCIVNSLLIAGSFCGGWSVHTYFSHPQIRWIYIPSTPSEKLSGHFLSRPFELRTTDQYLDPNCIFCLGNDEQFYRARVNIPEKKVLIEPVIPGS